MPRMVAFVSSMKDADAHIPEARIDQTRRSSLLRPVTYENPELTVSCVQSESRTIQNPERSQREKWLELAGSRGLSALQRFFSSVYSSSAHGQYETAISTRLCP